MYRAGTAPVPVSWRVPDSPAGVARERRYARTIERTTAATVWLAAAIGVMCGAGGYWAAALTAVLALLVLLVLRVVKPVLRHVGRAHGDLRVVYERGHGTIGPLIRQLEDVHCRVAQLHIEDDDDTSVDAPGLRCVTLFVQTSDDDGLAAAVTSFERRDEIVQLSVEPLAE